MCQADNGVKGTPSSASPLQSGLSADATKYITFVFPWTQKVSGTNAFRDSQFGPACGAATGNLLWMSDVFEEALGEIASGCSDAEEVAQDALDKVHEYIRQQMDAPQAPTPIEEPERSAGGPNAS